MYTPVQYVNLSMRERADFVDAWHFSVQGLRRQESKKVSVLRLRPEDLVRCKRNCGGKNNKPEVIKEIVRPFSAF